ncbi:helix-turn-helix transcriptional regulator [Kitasatospora sp. NPDC002965]|uniref:helix-turn-helix transcriptional regulator n=1 Tax=Kitasatospora sp. NPDC002965 TaxID=3154775 RepID=UPI0033A7A70E
MLDALGVPPQEEALYRALLRRPDPTLAELVEATGGEPSRLRRQLRELETKGLVTRSPTRPVRFRPSPPELAVEVLALSLHQQIDRARLAAVELDDLWRSGRAGHEPPVQIVQGRDANTQHFRQIQQSTRKEVLIFDMPPYVEEGMADQTEVQLDLMDRGVSYRTVYDRTALAEPEQLALARRLTQRGERARIVDGLPMKLLIADRTTALVPFVLAGERQTVVLRSSPLLHGLVALFEAMWERGTPLWGNGRPSDALSPEDVQLLGYAAAGYTDEIIARKVGVNKRTVERRMRRLMDTLGARTRFQAGLQAARRGLLG